MNKTAFLCGCGFGNRIGLTPNEAADLTAVREFADTLRKLGGPARLLGDQIDKAAQLAVASLSPEAKADKKHAFETFLVSFDAVPDTVRTLISDEAWQWFSLGHLVYRTSIAKVLKHDADSETAALKSIAGNLAMPQPLKQMFEKFLTEARKTKDPSRCFNAANAFSRTAYLVLDDNSSPRHAGVPSIEPPPSKVFIGHGRSTAWKDLKEFLVERMNLNYEEFNRESTAGITTKERLMEMLEQCSIAFLIMTAEDEQSDGSKHARLNVVHEIGLCQGRYGFKRGIVLVEDGCKEFSNISGLGQIRFAQGEIPRAFEEIRRILEREGLLQSSPGVAK